MTQRMRLESQSGRLLPAPGQTPDLHAARMCKRARANWPHLAPLLTLGARQHLAAGAARLHSQLVPENGGQLVGGRLCSNGGPGHKTGG